MSPKAAIKAVYDKAGGIVNSKTLSEVPRDRRQAYNAKSHSKSISSITSNQHKDLVYDLLEQHYGSLKNFVRNVSFDDTISCILATDQQHLQMWSDFVQVKHLLNAVCLELTPLSI